MPKNNQLDIILSTSIEDKIIDLFQENLNSHSNLLDAMDGFYTSINECQYIPIDIKVMFSNAVNSYIRVLRNKSYEKALRKTFNQLFELFEEKGLSFKIEARRKSAVNSVEKILKLLKSGKSLDLWRDIIGIRFIIYGKETEKLHCELYSMMEEIIQFMLEKSFTLCEAEETSKEVSLNEGIEILIPSDSVESLISPLYKSGIKDYIRYPKKNGYQSLHCSFRARNGSFLEIQIRSEAMHVFAELQNAHHNNYKCSRYGDKRLAENLDFSKITMSGFKYTENGIFDDIGLQKSKLTLYRDTL